MEQEGRLHDVDRNPLRLANGGHVHALDKKKGDNLYGLKLYEYCYNEGVGHRIYILQHGGCVVPVLAESKGSNRKQRQDIQKAADSALNWTQRYDKGELGNDIKEAAAQKQARAKALELEARRQQSPATEPRAGRASATPHYDDVPYLPGTEPSAGGRGAPPDPATGRGAPHVKGEAPSRQMESEKAQVRESRNPHGRGGMRSLIAGLLVGLFAEEVVRSSADEAQAADLAPAGSRPDDRGVGGVSPTRAFDAVTHAGNERTPVPSSAPAPSSTPRPE